MKHKNTRAVHGFKAHVCADADRALIEEVVVTPANVNDGKAGPEALPDEPGDTFADSAYRGRSFSDAVRAKGGRARVVGAGDVGTQREGNSETIARLEPADPPGPRAHRKDLRNRQAKLRPQANAMARPRQSRPPGSPHRHRLQLKTYPDYQRCSHRLTGSTATQRCGARNREKHLKSIRCANPRTGLLRRPGRLGRIQRDFSTKFRRHAWLSSRAAAKIEERSLYCAGGADDCRKTIS